MNIFFLSITFNVVAVGVWFYNVMNTGHWWFDELSVEGILFLVFGVASLFCVLVTVREASAIHKMEEWK